MPIRSRTKTRLLDAAEELFFSRGIAATSVDAIVERAGVSPATLYRGYASKEDLLAAALERRHAEWIATWNAAIEAQTTDRGRLLAVFDALDVFRTRPEGARWCAFLGSAAELVDPPATVAEALQRDTDTMRARLRELASRADVHRGPQLAEQLVLVVTGDLAMRLRTPAHSTDTARDIAAVLLAPRRPSARVPAGPRRRENS